MLQKIFRIKDSIDIYISDTEAAEKVLLTFHRMTTRERIEMVAGRQVAEFLALLDGKTTVKTLLSRLGTFNPEQAVKLLEYLSSQRLVIDVADKQTIDSRYERQIAFFDDMIPERPGEATQGILSGKKVVIMGCGAVGSAIAEILARAGVLHLTLVDCKCISANHVVRHSFVRSFDIGKRKVDVLSSQLKRINANISITPIHAQLRPETDLGRFIHDDANLVINTCDEPYIGHTSLKIGRFAHARNIPIYIAGGFDAHLMSSGELLYPPHTPCIDCAQNSFNTALKDWKPIYGNVPSGAIGLIESSKLGDDNKVENYLVGGAGGLAMMNGFSAFMGCMKILRFLSEDPSFQHEAIRYEYLLNSGEMTEFKMNKRKDCHVCDR